jgi:uncharacterized protein YjlB
MPDLLSEPTVERRSLTDDGTFPNNDELPTLLYRGALDPSAPSLPEGFEQVVRSNGWSGTWRNGIFGYHHYHSTAHEVLGVVRGEAQVQLGGPNGPVFNVEAGDVLILPAGVAHKNRGADRAFLVIGAYPDGQDWDLLRGADGERPEADENIAAVPLPKADPVYGSEGPLATAWGTREA